MFSSYYLLVCFLFSFVVCQPERLNSEECVDGSGISRLQDLFPEVLQIQGESVQQQDAVEVTVAEDFSVEYFSTYKILRNLRADETYVLYVCGMAPPSDDLIPEGAKLFETPLHSIAVDDTTALTFLNLLGVGDRVKYTSPFSSAACFQKLLQDCNRPTTELVSDNEDPYDYTTRLNEVAQDEIDAFFTFSASDDPLTIAFTATSDPGMLNRLEWIKFMSVFFNLESSANQLYDIYADIYNSIEVLDIPQADRPLVAWISWTSWTTPVAFTVSFADYKVELIANGGGKTFDKQDLLDLNPNITESFGSVSFDPATLTEEVAYELFIENVLKVADVVVDESYFIGQGEYKVPEFKERYGISEMEDTEFPFLVNKQLYTLDKSTAIVNNGSDWFESAVVLAHETLTDFVSILQPERKQELGLRDPRWLKNIAMDEDVVFISPDECEVNGCAFNPLPLCPVTDIACLTA